MSEADKTQHSIWDPIPVPFGWCMSTDSVAHAQKCAQKVSLAYDNNAAVWSDVALPLISTLSWYRQTITKLEAAHKVMIDAKALIDAGGYAGATLRDAIAEIEKSE